MKSILLALLSLHSLAYASDNSCTIRSITDWYPGGVVYFQSVSEEPELTKKIAKSKVIIDWEDYLKKLPDGKQMTAIQFAESTIDKINQATTENVCSKVPLNCGLKFVSNKYLGVAYLTYTFETIDPFNSKPVKTYILGNIGLWEGGVADVGFYEARLRTRDYILDQDDVEKRFPVRGFNKVLLGLGKLEADGVCKKTTIPPCKVRWKSQNSASDRVTVNISSPLFGEVNMRLDYQYGENDKVKSAIGQKFVEAGLCSAVILAD